MSRMGMQRGITASARWAMIIAFDVGSPFSSCTREFGWELWVEDRVSVATKNAPLISQANVKRTREVSSMVMAWCCINQVQIKYRK